MNNLIKEFYNHQQEITDQLNNHSKYFVNKHVDITITTPDSDTPSSIIHNVIFKGYTNEIGRLYINWNYTKLDGSESKIKGNRILTETTTVQITLYKPNSNQSNA